MSKEVREGIHKGCAAFRGVSRGRQRVFRLCYLLKCANFLGNVNVCGLLYWIYLKPATHLTILFADRRDRRKSPGVPGGGSPIGFFNPAFPDKIFPQSHNLDRCFSPIPIPVSSYFFFQARYLDEKRHFQLDVNSHYKSEHRSLYWSLVPEKLAVRLFLLSLSTITTISFI